jgi:sigma-B regulation protein RsbU (phosphoserine phosphatase)
MKPPPGVFDLSRTWAGRLFVVSLVFLVPLVVLQQFTTLPAFVELFRKVVSVALVVSSAGLISLVIWRNHRRVLWRVRRKLILSYLFLGLAPVVLVSLFTLVVAFVLYLDVAAYLFHEGFGDTVEDVQQFAETSAIEIGRNPDAATTGLARKYANLSAQYPALSFAVVPVADANGSGIRATSGAWRHAAPPESVPGWLGTTRSFRGVLTIDSPDESHMVIRAAAPTPDGAVMVIADLPVDTDLMTRMRDRSGTRIVSVTPCGASAPSAARPRNPLTGLFRQTVVFMDCVDWQTGLTQRLAISLDAPLGRLYDQLAAANSAPLGVAMGRWNFSTFLAFLAGLFLIIEGAALYVGAWFGRSITSAIHELFTGTERVRQGDFAHRIAIESRDQLGDLAESFNRMSGSIAHLLHVQREKQQLDDELRIARDIQKSLLPVAPPAMAGLDIVDICEPAREVGGDYYDFFELGPRQMGVLIADVSGKGTSAALYMAELKGLMLALSHSERSPRKLLLDVNRSLTDQLDNRSFITMTYAIIDLDAGTLTCARAGHTPMIVVSGGVSQLLAPDGMVLGLRLPGAATRFEQLLTEYTRPIGPGDVIVLYTDGVTEAMDGEGELFGDAALAHVVSSHHTLDAAGIRERVLRDVKAFVGDAEPHDDMTMVVIKIADRQVAIA